jgi:hypothetical protein
MKVRIVVTFGRILIKWGMRVPMEVTELFYIMTRLVGLEV